MAVTLLLLRVTDAPVGQAKWLALEALPGTGRQETLLDGHRGPRHHDVTRWFKGSPTREREVDTWLREAWSQRSHG